LKAKKIDGDALTFVVDNTFQYGQQKDGSHRFLVYHDKNNKQYQVRLPHVLTEDAIPIDMLSIDSSTTPLVA
jgi:hypothetical protein